MKSLTVSLTISVFIIVLSMSHQSVFAQSPSPTATDETETVSNSTDEAVQQNLKDRLKKVIEEKSDRIKGIMDGAPKRGFIGTVKRISEEALTLDTPRGPVVLTITSGIEFWEGKKTITPKEIEIGNEVIVIGEQNNDEFTPQRIYLSKTPLRPATRTIMIGNVKKIDKNAITITARTGEEKIFALSTKTRYANSDGETAKSTDFKTEQDVLLIATPEELATQTLKNSSGRVTVLQALAELKN